VNLTWDQLANVSASGLVSIASLVFATTYHRLAPWRSTPIGRHIMAVTVSMGLLGLYTVLATLWPHGPAIGALRVGRTMLLVSLAAQLAQRTRLLIKAQRDHEQ
jgi:hypothetical protein